MNTQPVAAVQRELILQVDNLRRMVHDDYDIDRASEQSLVISAAMIRVGLNLLAAALDVPIDERQALIAKYVAEAKHQFTEAAGLRR